VERIVLPLRQFMSGSVETASVYEASWPNCRFISLENYGDIRTCPLKWESRGHLSWVGTQGVRRLPGFRNLWSVSSKFNKLWVDLVPFHLLTCVFVNLFAWRSCFPTSGCGWRRIVWTSRAYVTGRRSPPVMPNEWMLAR